MKLPIPFFLHEFIMKMGLNPDPLAKALVKQIEMFCAWKALRHPGPARTCKRELTEFFEYARVSCISEIKPEHISAYVDSLNAEYRKQRIEKVLRQFMRYWYRMGLLTHEFSMTVQTNVMGAVEELHPKMHIDQVIRVQKHRKEGKSLRQIKILMETEDSKTYHLKQIQRWASYDIPELSTVSP